VGRAFELVGAGLAPFVERQMKSTNGPGWLAAFLASGQGGPSEGSLQDPAFCLRVITEAWESSFRSRLTKADRNLVFELRDWRNRWAHNEAFNADDTYRALDSIERLLVSVDAPQAGEVGRSKTELRRLVHEAETKKAGPIASATTGGVPGLRPWREVIVPHDDVAAGRYELSEFAANLYQVAGGQGATEYTDPVEFYRRTFLTEGLRHLLAQAVKRLDGTGGAPVVDLQTTFGGGKTHTLIALWHLCSGLALDQFPQELQDVVRGVGVDELPKVTRAALVGNWIAAGQPTTKPDGTEVFTLWGELAWQLAGKDGYALVSGADQSGTSPGGALADLFAACSPCLVLIDEWVAYARQLYGSESGLSGGSFDSHVSFAQALTEAARATDGALLVVSLPASVNLGERDKEAPGSGSSSIELGGPGGAEALRRLRAVMGRIESSWRPASVEEGFEIVRRRLFQPIDAARLADRDATTRAFADYYGREKAEFPNDCRQAGYEARMRAAYPIHPELFDRLYRDWSTLERFQRTRGVLRLMAQVVGTLWRSGDGSPFILPGSVPLDDAAVATELARNLDDSWKAVMDTDVDGTGSVPASLDAAFPNLGRYGAARKVARTVFLGSAPTVHSPHRGIEAARVRLGCAAPGEPVATYADALARLSDRATYMYVSGERYWYGLAPSVSRLARERVERLMSGDLAEVDAEIASALARQAGPGRQRDHHESGFAGVHFTPANPSDVEDDDRARLVVLGPNQPYVPKSDHSEALSAARTILEQRGSGPRHYRNMLVFLAADQRRLEDLRQGAAEALAWRSVNGEARAKELDLTVQQAAQAQDKANEAEGTLNRRLAEAYTWALVPVQPDPTGPIDFEPVRVEGTGDLVSRTARKLGDKGHLYLTYAPSILRTLVLEGPLSSVWEPGHVSVGAFWDALSRYPYLPRLRDREVLLHCAESGPSGFAWQAEGFALADGYDGPTGRYLGLVVGPASASSVNDKTLLVKPELAVGQADADRAAAASAPGVTTEVPGTAAPQGATGSDGGPVTPAPSGPARPKRFHGSVVLRSERLNLEFGRVVQEVVQRLADAGAAVEVTVEVSAGTRDGFEEPAVRTVTENARTLHFKDQGFEDE
jgi:predicted AAA+ superfamily ATPase